MPHINYALDYVVNVYIVHRDRVLLCHHKALDLWLPIGGHIELGEDPVQTAYREVAEECGLEIELYGYMPDGTWTTDAVLQELFKEKFRPIKPILAPASFNRHRITDTHDHMAMNYYATSRSREVVLAEREHHAIEWFAQEDLQDMRLQPDVRFTAANSLLQFGPGLPPRGD